MVEYRLPDSLEKSESGATERRAQPNSRRIRVYVNSEEFEAIKERAAFSSMSVSRFMKLLALGHEVQSTVDDQVVTHLANINVALDALKDRHDPAAVNELIEDIRAIIKRI